MKTYTMSQILEKMPEAKIENSMFSFKLTLDSHGQYLLTIICAGRSRTFFLFLDKIGRSVVNCIEPLENIDEIDLADIQRIPCRVVLVHDNIEGIGNLWTDRFVSFNIMEFFQE